jgi:hypothetical protein
MVDAGSGTFMVTANHVYTGFCAVRAAGPDLVRIPGDLMRFPPEQRLISADPV